MVNTTLAAFQNITFDIGSTNAPQGNLGSYFSFGSGVDPRLNGTWATFTPVPTWTGGTPTAAVLSARYTNLGKTVFIEVQIYTGSALNGATGVSFTLPIQLKNGLGSVFSGIIAGNGILITAYASAGTSIVQTYGFTLVAGNYLLFSGTYESV